MIILEFQECKKVLKDQGMQTFVDWLCYYNDLDVAPGLEALENMRVFYKDKGIEILKDSVRREPALSLEKFDRVRRRASKPLERGL